MKKEIVKGPRLRATYECWTNMQSRCYNRKVGSYPNYGGRGVYVCERWRGRGGFRHFLEDMGVKPDGLTIERNDGNGPYAPDNCRWATRQWQSINRRTTVFVEYGGERLCAKEWAAKLGVSYNALRSRAKVRGSYAAAIASYEVKPLRVLH